MSLNNATLCPMTKLRINKRHIERYHSRRSRHRSHFTSNIDHLCDKLVNEREYDGYVRSDGAYVQWHKFRSPVGYCAVTGTMTHFVCSIVVKHRTLKGYIIITAYPDEYCY